MGKPNNNQGITKPIKICNIEQSGRDGSLTKTVCAVLTLADYKVYDHIYMTTYLSPYQTSTFQGHLN